MYEKYQYLFDLYLKKCKEKYDPENPYESLKDCIKLCDASRNSLFGMLSLMAISDIIDYKTENAEVEKILKTFSSIKLYNAFMDDGEIFSFLAE